MIWNSLWVSVVRVLTLTSLCGEAKLGCRRPRYAKSIASIFFALTLLFSLSGAQAQTTRSFCLELTATTSSSSPYITLSWPLPSNVSSQRLWVRTKGSSSWGSVITLASTATSYADTNAQPGVVYEYSLRASASSPSTIYGSIVAGYNIPIVEKRGKVILLVDNTMATTLAPELNQLQQNLVADGWIVYRHDVARMSVDPSDSSAASYANRLTEVQAVRTLVQADYNTSPGTDWALFIIGRVPIPYSGFLGPDGHGSRAWPTDSYYADVDGTWTDTSVNSTSWSDARGWNVIGDGKFDQTTIPSKVELQCGRVDLSNMGNVPSGMTEAQLLRQYLVRDHRFRRGLAPYNAVARRALIEDCFPTSGSAYSFAADAYRTGFAFFGRNSGQTDTGAWFPDLETNSVLLSGCYASASYIFQGASGNYTYFSTVDYNLKNSKSVFCMQFGSYFGDWDNTDNYLRAPLAGTQDSLGLCNMWSGRGYFQLFHMALGEVIGYGVRYTQNNTAATADWVQSEAGFSYLSAVTYGLMGDPTLRLHTVLAPSGVTAVSSTGKIDLSWIASSDASVVGYHVYRATSTSGPFTRISGVTATDTNPTGTPVTTTTYTDTDSSLVSGTAYTYQVKAVKLESSASGTYANQSLGESVTITHLAATPSPNAPTRLSVSRTGTTICSLSWDDNATNETGYRLERYSIATSTWTKIAPLGANITTYVDSAAGTADQPAYYRVRAEGATPSDYSNVAADWNFSGLVYSPEYGILTTKSAGIITLHASRYSGTAGNVSVNMTASDLYSTPGTDYVTPTGTMAWAHGESGIKSGTLSILSPATKQPTKVVKVTYASPTNGAVVNMLRSSALVFIADPSAQVLSAPWATATFGSQMVGDDGYAESANSTYGIMARTGVFGASSTEDSIRFLYQPMSGDFIFSARVAFQALAENPISLGGAFGLMLRSSLTSNSAMSSIYMMNSTTVTQLGRTTTGAASGSLTTVRNGTATRWLRLVRTGTDISVYYSDNGVSWNQLGSTVTIANLPSTVYIGFFGAGNEGNNFSTSRPNDQTLYHYARFESPSLFVIPYTTVGDISTVSALTGSHAGEVSVTWSAATGATAYVVERSTASNSGFMQAARVIAPTTTLTDGGLKAGTTYFYRVKAVNSLYESAYTSVVSAVPYLPTGISGWRYTYFSATDSVAGYSDDLSTPANDGVTNLMAYALGGLNPLAYKSPSSLPVVQKQTVDGSAYLTCTFTYNTAATDVQVVVEVASDVNGPWTTLNPFLAANQVSVTANTPSVGLETIVVKDTQPISADSKRFMRFRVTNPN